MKLRSIFFEEVKIQTEKQIKFLPDLSRLKAWDQSVLLFLKNKQEYNGRGGRGCKGRSGLDKGLFVKQSKKYFWGI